MKEELRLIKQAIGTLQRAVALLEDRLPVDTEKKQNGFSPPTREEANRFHCAQNFRFDLDSWWNHYTSNGWKVGKNPMKDWHAAMWNWNARHKKASPDRKQVQRDATGKPINPTRQLL